MPKRTPVEEDPILTAISTHVNGLKTQRLQLALIRAGISLATTEGQARATSAELLARARRESGVNAMASVAGLALADLGLPTSVSKGQKRFTLDLADLKIAADTISKQITDVEDLAAELLADVQEVEDQVEGLQYAYSKAMEQRQLLKDMEVAVKKHHSMMYSRNPEIIGLQNRYNTVMENLNRKNSLLKRIAELEPQVADLPDLADLEQRRRDLEQQLTAVQEQSQELGILEEQVTKKQETVNKTLHRNELVKQLQAKQNALMGIDAEIRRLESQIASADAEIDRKQGLLDRMLRRNA